MIAAALLVLAIAVLATGGVVVLALRRLARKLHGHEVKADFALNALVNTQAVLTSLTLPTRFDAAVCEDGLVCSMTTLESRLPVVHLAIESILLQSRRPRSVELYLSERLRHLPLPASLKRLEPLGLNVHFVPDVGPHTKLIYALDDFPDATIVTADDDIYYPAEAFATLLGMAARHPKAVVGNWARRLGFDRRGRVLGIRDGMLLTPPDFRIEHDRSGAEPDIRTFVYGTGGVLYPSGSLDHRVRDVGAFQRLCPTEDDIWFKAMALLKGTPAVPTNLGMDPRHHTVRGTQTIALRHTNHDQRRNETQMRAVFDAYGLYGMFSDRRP